MRPGGLGECVAHGLGSYVESYWPNVVVGRYFGLDATQASALVRAGLDTPEKVLALTGAELVGLPRIGRGTAAHVEVCRRSGCPFARAPEAVLDSVGGEDRKSVV